MTKQRQQPGHGTNCLWQLVAPELPLAIPGTGFELPLAVKILFFICDRLID
jgi:hypothetical protein